MRGLFFTTLSAGLALAATTPSLAAPAVKAPAAHLSFSPTNVVLSDRDSQQQLVISETVAGRVVDRTSTARVTSLDPKIATITPTGLLVPVADGTARIQAKTPAGVAETRVTVRLRNPRPLTFTRDIHPLLSQASCNGGTCHGKAEGQHGFRLSLFGYDPQFDYEAIARASEGRRLVPNDAGRSLFLLKATSTVPHAGGLRIRTGSRDYRVLARWIASGAPYSAPAEPELKEIAVYPPERALGMGASQQLIVTARYADGTTRDVTREAKFTSNNPALLNAEPEGRISSRTLPGAAAVMVNYQGLVATSRIVVPRPDRTPLPALPKPANFIDQHVWARLSKLRIQPSEPASDEEFLRRAFLDLIGTLPTVEETRAFLAECEAEVKANTSTPTSRGVGGAVTAAASGPRGSISPSLRRRGGQGGEVRAVPVATSGSKGANSPRIGNRGADSASSLIAHRSSFAPKTRAKLIDALLQRPEYADFWALKWADILRVSKSDLGAKGAHAFYTWLRQSQAENIPYDKFVREIVTASGNSGENGPVNLFRVLNKPEEAASSLSQVFLGVRLECAQCHHHPFEKWSQDDYYGMVGFFTRLKTKPDGQHSVILTAGGNGDAVHPRTGKPVPPHALETQPDDMAQVPDRRQRLADWMSSPENRYVPRMLVNRIWAHFLGRGIVDPVDDFRDTNPPSNPELLDALAKELISNGYDVKKLIRTIMTSRVYQLSSQSNPTNAGDEQSFSRAYPKRLTAEALMDAVASATGVSPELPGLPRGTRAIQVWDSEWSTQWQSYFLSVFGRPARTHPCECERSQEPSIVQVLHLMNAPEIQQQISDRKGRARLLAESDRTPRQIIEELFLAAHSRRPTPAEEKDALQAFATPGKDRVQATEDVLWALMNTVEFVFNH